ncbi:GntR family transcriptional regulator [Psychromarinibacter sp. C21-152]|uniref:GntR family transcriptional regulator n=1 Tax=Psychromarinibacter sediminicola TaxID=3033385 RepID=A0AAE3T963_9RHOB|nr:GntR family transcriptional regulator [Psychromarinibacter sediminicola]MDF0600250.1 GntR family transcriptional regulator [Psychromarinibacter sediminicola]
MSKSKTAQAPAVRRGSGASHVYERIKSEIIDLTLAPGTPIDDSHLAERFNMSRTPIREAMVRLAAEGLITTLTNRATIVSNIDFLNMSDFFDALTLMNRVTAREAAAKHVASDIETVRARQAEFAEAVAAQDALAMIRTNRDFHVAIAEAGGNQYYVDLFTRLLDEGRRILRLYYYSFDDRLPGQYITEHEDLIEAIVARDVARADRLGREHADQIVGQIQSYITADRRRNASMPL